MLILYNKSHVFLAFACRSGIRCDYCQGQKIETVAEIKHSLSPTLHKGFYEAMADLNNPPASIMYPGDDTYSLAKGIRVSSLQNFLEILSNKKY